MPSLCPGRSVCCAGSSVFLPACLRPLLLLLPSVHFYLSFSPFLSASILFFYIYPPLPFSRSIHRPACLSEAGYNVTSLIIGVVKRVVRNNYEPATPSVPCGRRRCVTRALSTPRYWPRRGQFQVSRVLILQNQTSAGRRAVRLKNKRANYVSTD